MTSDITSLKIGVLGCGNVGAALVTLVEAQRATVLARTGIDLTVTRVAVRNISAPRDVELADGVLTRDAMGVATDPDVDIIVEHARTGNVGDGGIFVYQVANAIKVRTGEQGESSL